MKKFIYGLFLFLIVFTTMGQTGFHETIILERVSFYNPFDPNQTDDTPGICAWNYPYKKGDNIIAVSRDLIKFGYTNNVRVRIYGLPEDLPTEYIIKDKMNKRYKKSIDIAIPDNKRCKKLGVLTNIKMEMIKGE